jgi:2-oxoglutarate ferredoxin oxidoreductase subunit alpha
VLSAADLERLGGFSRYLDVDGDGATFRTLPGTPHEKAGYFTRGTGHDEHARYSEKQGDWVANMDRLSRKFESIRGAVPAPEVRFNAKARVGVVCCGTSRYAMEEACDQLRDETGLETSWLRLKAYPFTVSLDEFIKAHDRVYVIDQNRDAQLLALMKLDLDAALLMKLRSVRYYGGMPLDARTVSDEIARQEGIR